jgi:galactonate dehydratase
MASDVPWRKEICTEDVTLRDGLMTIPEKPGLGLDIDEAAIAKYPYQPISLRHYKGTLTEIRPQNATSYFSK